mmetsp:Transcript_13348/g.22694  ORF Transcript_13348/g.22694 Transcript_13348/m.22694 type:complete len:100 (+) Transcript_13348:133-432(+)
MAYAVFVLFFVGVYMFWRQYFRGFGAYVTPSFYKRYQSRNESDQVYMLSGWAGNTHHVIIIVLVFRFLIFDDSCDVNNGILTKLTDPECYVKVNKIHVF